MTFQASNKVIIFLRLQEYQERGIFRGSTETMPINTQTQCYRVRNKFNTPDLMFDPELQPTFGPFVLAINRRALEDSNESEMKVCLHPSAINFMPVALLSLSRPSVRFPPRC